MPGMEKTVSTMRVPVTSAAVSGTRMVTIGIREFLSTCLRTTASRLSPLALASVT